MPTYFFHIRSRDNFIYDLEGIDLPDLDAVREEAREAARDILADRVQTGTALNHQTFQVENEAGEIVLDYPLSDALA